AYTAHLPSGRTYSVEATQTPPAGLTLSTTGTLSGTATQYTTSSFLVAATGGTTALVEVGVRPPAHALEVTEFRTSGPLGPGDWFAEVTNTTSSAISLAGWALEMKAAPSATPAPSTWATPDIPTTRPLQVGLGAGTLAPARSVLVTGPRFSASTAVGTPDVIGPSSATAHSGFAAVAPDDTVTDAAGIAGSPEALSAGTALTAPAALAETTQSAFVRHRSDGNPVDTTDNASDFTFQAIGPSFTPAPPGLSPYHVATVTSTLVGATTAGSPRTLSATVGSVHVTATVPGGVLPA